MRMCLFDRRGSSGVLFKSLGNDDLRWGVRRRGGDLEETWSECGDESEVELALPRVGSDR
jgi:hypothetical protein